MSVRVFHHFKLLLDSIFMMDHNVLGQSLILGLYTSTGSCDFGVLLRYPCLGFNLLSDVFSPHSDASLVSLEMKPLAGR